MRRSLRSHIVYLENTIQSLRDSFTKPGLSIDEVQDLELQLTLAESALAHYRAAYELESSVSGAEPTDPMGFGEGGAGETPDAPRRRPKTGETRLARMRRVRTVWPREAAIQA